MAGAQAGVNQEATGGPIPALEDQRCNGTLHKKSLSQAGTEDSGGQRYSADPTIFLGERASRGDTDEDGYMTPMKDKSSSGTGLSRKSLIHSKSRHILILSIAWSFKSNFPCLYVFLTTL